MKTKIRPYRFLLVLIFGLTSCAPDNSPTVTQDSQFQVEVINQDQSRFRLMGLKEININNSIDLGLSADQIQKTITTSTTHCQKSNSPFKEIHKAEFLESSQIDVINLLPVNILTPNPLEKVEIFCDISLQIKRDQAMLFEVELKQLQIKEFENENGLNPHFIQSSEGTHFLLPQIASAQVLGENRTQKTALHTLCENKQSFKFIEPSQSITVAELFDDSFFTNQPLIYCRFFSREEKTNITTISSPFGLQKEAPEVSVTFDHFFTGELMAVSQGQRLAEIKIKNKSRAPLLVSYREIFSHIKPIPIYTSKNYHQVLSKTSSPFLASWIVMPGLKIIKKGEVEVDAQYLIEPEQEMILELKSQSFVECQSGKMPLQPGAVLSICNQDYLMSGIFYDIEAYPIIKINLWHDHSEFNWITKDLNTMIGSQHDPRFSFWSPNTKIRELCELRTIVNQTITHYQEVPPYLESFTGCKAN